MAGQFRRYGDRLYRLGARPYRARLTYVQVMNKGGNILSVPLALKASPLPSCDVIVNNPLLSTKVYPIIEAVHFLNLPNF